MKEKKKWNAPTLQVHGKVEDVTAEYICTKVTGNYDWHAGSNQLNSSCPV